jgi:multiple sugar transport system substrate-binding protein
MQYSAAANKYFPQFVKAFEAKNPSIHVNLQVINWTQGHQVLNTQIGGGNPPDVAIIGTRWLPEYASNNLLVPLDSLMTSSFRNEFYKSALDSVKYQGKQYALPEAMSVRLLIYNKTLFKKAGISSPPKTWTQLGNDAVKIHQKTGQAGYGLVGSQVETELPYFETLWSFGGDILHGKTGALTSKPAVQALQFLVNLIKRGGTESSVTSASRVSLENQFAAGKLGMMIDGPWLVKSALANHLKIAEANMPAQPHVKQRNVVITDSMVMFKGKNQAAAWKFMQFMFTRGVRGTFDSTEGMIPTMSIVGREKGFKSSPIFSSYLKALHGSTVFEPVVPKFDTIALAVTDAVQAAYSGSATPQQALSRANAKVTAALGG